MKNLRVLHTTTLTIISLVLSLCFLSACGKNSALEIGFNRIGSLPSIMGATKSDHTDYSIDDITLDFYYGGHVSEYAEDSDRTTLGVALYFCNEAPYKALRLDTNETSYEDYQEMEGLYFVKFINAEDFNGDEYGVNVSRLGKVTFQHCEILTVPAEVFIEDDDHFGLAMLEFYCLKDQTGYYIDYVSCLEIKYEFLDAQNVRLSAPSHLF